MARVPPDRVHASAPSACRRSTPLQAHVETGNALKVCIFGAGAIGGFMGVHLASSGAEVSLVARGDHLAAMRANGVRLQVGGEEDRVARLPSTDKPSDL